MLKNGGFMTKRQKVRRALILILFLYFPIIMDYFSPYLIIDGALHGIIVVNTHGN